MSPLGRFLTILLIMSPIVVTAWIAIWFFTSPPRHETSQPDVLSTLDEPLPMRDYLVIVRDEVGRFSAASTVLSNEFADPQIGVSSWERRVRAGTDEIDGVYYQLLSVTPPPEAEEFHRVLIDAIRECHYAAVPLRAWLETNDMDDLTQSTRLLSSCQTAFSEVSPLLHDISTED